MVQDDWFVDKLTRTGAFWLALSTFCRHFQEFRKSSEGPSKISKLRTENWQSQLECSISCQFHQWDFSINEKLKKYHQFFKYWLPLVLVHPFVLVLTPAQYQSFSWCCMHQITHCLHDGSLEQSPVPLLLDIKDAPIQGWALRCSTTWPLGWHLLLINSTDITVLWNDSSGALLVNDMYCCWCCCMTWCADDIGNTETTNSTGIYTLLLSCHYGVVRKLCQSSYTPAITAFDKKHPSYGSSQMTNLSSRLVAQTSDTLAAHDHNVMWLTRGYCLVLIIGGLACLLSSWASLLCFATVSKYVTVKKGTNHGPQQYSLLWIALRYTAIGVDIDVGHGCDIFMTRAFAKYWHELFTRATSHRNHPMIFSWHQSFAIPNICTTTSFAKILTQNLHKGHESQRSKDIFLAPGHLQSLIRILSRW